MNRNVIIVMIGGFLIAILVALLVQTSLSGNKEPAPVAVKEVKKVQILVAKGEVKAGKKVTKDTATWKAWPEDAVFPGAIVREDDASIEESAKGVLVKAVKKDQPITQDMVADNANTRFLAASIADGKRAFTIEVDPASMVAGFAGPGDYVDILLTYRHEIEIEGAEENPVLTNYIAENIDERATETILQNIKLLGVDQAARRQEEGMAKLGRTVTLEVEPRQAEILALAQRMGDLSFALRKLGDEKIIVRDYPIVTDARTSNVLREILKGINEDPSRFTMPMMPPGVNPQTASPTMPALNINSGQNDNYVRIYTERGVQDIPVNQ